MRPAFFFASPRYVGILLQDREQDRDAIYKDKQAKWDFETFLALQTNGTLRQRSHEKRP